jgi:hypothetical protein
MEKPPIFIVGCPRSGTTLVRVILDSHPNICCGPETHLIKNLKTFNETIQSYWNMLEPYDIDKNIITQRLGELFLLFLDHYTKMKNKQRWAEKTPNNIFYVDFINELFPNCQFINVIRDGRDVVCSYKERWGSKTILYAIKEWNRAINLTYAYRTKFPEDRYMEVRYEELVSHPERETKRMMEFLGEKWTPDLLEHHNKQHDFWFKKNGGVNVDLKIERQPTRHSPSQPIFSSSVGKWKKNLNIVEKAVVKLLIQENLEKLGYV